MVYFSHHPKKSMATSSRLVKKAPRARQRASATHVVSLSNTPRQHHLCQSCHALPVGSMELVALLLVLVFSLSAVLFTSVYALQGQQAKVQALTAQLQ